VWQARSRERGSDMQVSTICYTYSQCWYLLLPVFSLSQCARRHITCEYPKESRRGQHKRTRRKKTHDHDVNASSAMHFIHVIPLGHILTIIIVHSLFCILKWNLCTGLLFCSAILLLYISNLHSSSLNIMYI
jgi:hypothetical protein